jgi:endonuclease YncB( thermonuclease family)
VFRLIVRASALTVLPFMLCATASAQLGLDPLAAWNDGQSYNDLMGCTITDGCNVCTLNRVIDGDTFDMSCGKGVGDVTLRLHGVDTPEIGKPKCEREALLGYQAKQFAIDWLTRAGPNRLIVHQAGKDRNARLLGMVTLRGRDLGSDLVMRGLAKPWAGREAKPSWCP